MNLYAYLGVGATLVTLVVLALHLSGLPSTQGRGRFAVDGKPVDMRVIGALPVLHLIESGQPQLFVSEVQGMKVLAHRLQKNDCGDVERVVCAPISEEKLKALTAGEITGRECLNSAPRLWVVDYSKSRFSRAWEIHSPAGATQNQVRETDFRAESSC